MVFCYDSFVGCWIKLFSKLSRFDLIVSLYKGWGVLALRSQYMVSRLEVVIEVRRLRHASLIVLWSLEHNATTNQSELDMKKIPEVRFESAED